MVFELRNSWLESRVFQVADRHLTYRVADGPSNAIDYPAAGPYDWALGYARIPVFLLRLQAAGFHVDAQAEDSKFIRYSRAGAYIPDLRRHSTVGGEHAVVYLEPAHAGFEPPQSESSAFRPRHTDRDGGQPRRSGRQTSPFDRDRRLVRQELIGVVPNGTGRRAVKSIVLSNGKIIPVGGKTGTGDNRLESFTASGHVTGSKVVSRTATFAFMVGDRFYGTIVAYVPGSKAASYRFTSALAVQIFKDLAPQIKPLIERAEPSSTARTDYASRRY